MVSGPGPVDCRFTACTATPCAIARPNYAMAQMLKGLGLMGAGAYGYQHLQTHDMVGTLGRVVGSLDGHPGRLASSIGASTSGNEVRWTC